MKLKTGIVVIVLVAGAFLLWKFWPGGSSSAPQINIEFPWELGQPQTYEQPEDNFTFSYPQKLNVTETAIEEIEGGKRILVESEEPKKGFEMIILPFDETGLLTAERIRQDLPDMLMENIRNILISNNITAISFDSIDENIGETHEVWFVYNGYLYQARTYRDFGQTMEAILQTWKFK